MHRNCVPDVAVEIETVFPPVEGRPHAGFNEPLGSAQNAILLELSRSWSLSLEVSGRRPPADVQLPDVEMRETEICSWIAAALVMCRYVQWVR